MSGTNPVDEASPTSLPSLQLKEAEWVHEEIQDCVKLIQRYRATYLAAVFATIGWLLARALESPIGGAERTLELLRRREDIATVLCLVPLLNCFFVVLVFETQFRMQSLATYRLLLGRALGGEAGQAWRWEYWKESPEGSFRVWTNPSNIVFGLVGLTLPSAALWFGFPAVWSSTGLLRTFWGFSVTILALFVVLVTYLSIKYVDRNNVTREINIDWLHLGPHTPRKARRRTLMFWK